MESCEWQSSDAGRVVLSGQLTRNTVPAIWSKRREWLANGNAALTFDMAGVEKVDSAGIAMLLQAKSALRTSAREMIIENASEQFEAMLKVSGANTLLTFNGVNETN